MTTRFADNQALLTANRYWLVALAWAKSQPLDMWRNLVVGLAVFWLCHSLASLFWVIFPVPNVQQPSTFAAPVAAQRAAAPTVSVDLSSLQAMSLFGKSTGLPADLVAQANSEPEPPSDIDAATTKLSIKLFGVIASNDSDVARAIIESGGEQALYRIGEEIDKNRGVKLSKVMEQRVIINNKGKFESLWLYSEEDFKKSASTRNSYKVSRKSESSRDREPVRKTIPSSKMPKSISDVVRFSVAREEGKMVGYKVRPGRDRELFEQVGLQSGDIVTSVNGREMSDPKQLREVYQELKSATEASLQVRRGEDEIPITISIQE